MDSSWVEHSSDVFFLLINWYWNKCSSHYYIPLKNQHIVWIILLFFTWIHPGNVLLPFVWISAFYQWVNEFIEHHGEHEYDDINIVCYKKSQWLTFVKIKTPNKHSQSLFQNKRNRINNPLTLLIQVYSMTRRSLQDIWKFNTVTTVVDSNSILRVFENSDKRLLKGILLNLYLHSIQAVKPFQNWEQQLFVWLVFIF